MKDILSEEYVEKTWQQVAGFTSFIIFKTEIDVLDKKAQRDIAAFSPSVKRIVNLLPSSYNIGILLQGV